jgi:hypothetical protein
VVERDGQVSIIENPQEQQRFFLQKAAKTFSAETPQPPVV